MNKKITSASIKNLVIKTLKDNKAADVVALNVKKLTDVTDYMIICTANSSIHTKSLIKKTREQLLTVNIKPIGVEGKGIGSEWLLADFGHVVVHVMTKPMRELYNLEKLWESK